MRPTRASWHREPLGLRFDAKVTRRKRPKRKRPVPRAAFRRLKAVRAPHAVELKLSIGYRRAMRSFTTLVRKAILPKVKKYAAPEGNADADPPDPDKLIKATRRAAGRTFERSGLASLTKNAALGTVTSNQTQFEGMGLPTPNIPKAVPEIGGWMKDSVGRISGVQNDELDTIHEILVAGQGRRHEAIAAEIEERLGMVEEKAEAIARDQVLTLNGKITRHRHVAAGIKSYIWTTAGDERVRSEHEELDGQEFSWDSPPEPGHPGEDYNCRCVAYPVIPDLDDGSDEDAPDADEPVDGPPDDEGGDEDEDEDGAGSLAGIAAFIAGFLMGALFGKAKDEDDEDDGDLDLDDIDLDDIDWDDFDPEDFED